MNSILQGSFEISEREIKLYEIAKTYHQNCEVYDSLVCTGPIGRGGGILPATNEEFILINKNAQFEKEQAYKIGNEFGFTRDEIRESISKWRNTNKI
jgi:hypothetical protein